MSPATVSDLNKKIYGAIEAWRNRPIEGEHPYVFLDGIVLKRTWAGEVRNVSLPTPRRHYHATAALEAEIAPLRPRCHSPSLIYIHEFFCTIQCPPADLSLAQSCLAFSTVSKDPIWAR